MPWNEIEAALDDLLSSFLAAPTAFIVQEAAGVAAWIPMRSTAPTRTRTS